MTALRLPAAFEAASLAAASTPALDLLMAFGSRARGDADSASDWDFAYLASNGFDQPTFLATVVERVGSDRVDLVDLRRASGLLRYRVARDGEVLHEVRPGLADAFRLEAIQFWCDAEPVLRRGYDQVLAELKR